MAGVAEEKTNGRPPRSPSEARAGRVHGRAALCPQAEAECRVGNARADRLSGPVQPK